MEINFRHKDQMNLYGERHLNNTYSSNNNLNNNSNNDENKINSRFRNKDTLDVFEEKYRANKQWHNKIKESKEKQKAFNDKLFDSGPKQNERINTNLNNLRQVQRDIFRNKI